MSSVSTVSWCCRRCHSQCHSQPVDVLIYMLLLEMSTTQIHESVEHTCYAQLRRMLDRYDAFPVAVGSDSHECLPWPKSSRRESGTHASRNPAICFLEAGVGAVSQGAYSGGKPGIRGGGES
ncbi:uncharacterized protein BDV17DRAFT_14938 [Aspergillus undulatus]|uniref:uncharacterized protein n=1 Tax=Aspergillus undulatus TaxID=1810928 RepID=UPI003CCCF2D0